MTHVSDLRLAGPGGSKGSVLTALDGIILNNGKEHLRSAFFMTGMVLGPLHVLTSLIFSAAL